MGEEVIVGIRPEDMVVLPDESEEGLEAKINVYEMLGAEAYLILTVMERAGQYA